MICSPGRDRNSSGSPYFQRDRDSPAPPISSGGRPRAAARQLRVPRWNLDQQSVPSPRLQILLFSFSKMQAAQAAWACSCPLSMPQLSAVLSRSRQLCQALLGNQNTDNGLISVAWTHYGESMLRFQLSIKSNRISTARPRPGAWKKEQGGRERNGFEGPTNRCLAHYILYRLTFIPKVEGTAIGKKRGGDPAPWHPPAIAISQAMHCSPRTHMEHSPKPLA